MLEERSLKLFLRHRPELNYLWILGLGLGLDTIDLVLIDNTIQEHTNKSPVLLEIQGIRGKHVFGSTKCVSEATGHVDKCPQVGIWRQWWKKE